MFDSAQYLEAFRSADSPIPHAIRGISAALVALTALANVTGNRAAILAQLRLRHSPKLTFATPSRTGFAITVFIGVFRYLQRSASIRAKRDPGNKMEAAPEPTRDALLPIGVIPAAAVASAMSTLWMAPESRPAVLSLLATNAASKVFNDFLAKYPDFSFSNHLNYSFSCRLDLFVGVLLSGELRALAHETNSQKRGIEATCCDRAARKVWTRSQSKPLSYSSCRAKLWTVRTKRVFLRVVKTSLRLYAPVHLTTSILAQRHSKVRSKSATTQLKGFATKLVRSSTYSIGYVYLGWMLCCVLGKIGDRSILARKLQFFLSGAIPSLAILAESPGRRRSIGLILASYALVSAGNVVTQKIALLQPGVSPVRGALEAGCVATAISIVISGYLESNHLVRRMLLGDVEARAFQDALQQTKSTTSRDDSVPTLTNSK